MDKYIGKRLDGRYEIHELIGVGGMANVYRCNDTLDDREVAIKILKMNTSITRNLSVVLKMNQRLLQHFHTLILLRCMMSASVI